MQTLIHVYCKPGPSLREHIKDDKRLVKHELEVAKMQEPGRAPGWLKVHSTRPGAHGALNIQWLSTAGVLQCRVVNRGAGKPNLIVGDFLDYVLARFRRRVRSITIIPG